MRMKTKTVVHLELDLTINTISGKPTAERLINFAKNFLAGTPTKLVIWDFTTADLSDFSRDDLRRLARLPKQYVENRPQGQSALIFSRNVEYGLGRMFVAFSELEKTPSNYRSFRNMADARSWLGIPLISE